MCVVDGCDGAAIRRLPVSNRTCSIAVEDGFRIDEVPVSKHNGDCYIFEKIQLVSDTNWAS